jgi:oligosaccharide repeat unit polymerase
MPPTDMPPTKQSLAAPMVAIAATLAVISLNVTAGAIVALVVAAILAYRESVWIAVCAAAWVVVFLAVLYIPGLYDSWAGPAVIPVLACYIGIFLAGWAVARRFAARSTVKSERPEVSWPSEFRLRAFLFILLGIALVAAALRFRDGVPPLFSPNPDVARELLRYHTNLLLGLLWEAFTLGMSISLFRLLTGGPRGRWLYLGLVVVFTGGSALGASKNSVLIGIVTALVASLSVYRRQPGVKRRGKASTTTVVVLIGCLAIGAAVFLGAQRTLAGTGNFEDGFRSQFGGSAVAASIASLDLSLSSSTETFGRLWVQRDRFEAGHGRYSLIFSGRPGQRLFGAHKDLDLYAITSQLSQPYYMNTATFVAIPLLDFGPVGAAVFMLVLGLGVGLIERRFEVSAGPAGQLGRGFIIYFAAFGIYELYPLIQPIWLAIVPGLWCLHLIGKRVR